MKNKITRLEEDDTNLYHVIRSLQEHVTLLKLFDVGTEKKPVRSYRAIKITSVEISKPTKIHQIYTYISPFSHLVTWKINEVMLILHQG